MTLAKENSLLLAAFGLALALRLVGLNHESIWYDEAMSLDMARASAHDIFTGAKADIGNPAGYFLLLHYWQRWFGASLEAARVLSAVTGALASLAVWLLARACGLPRRTGLWAAFLVAVCPPLVYLGQEARVFAMFATLATLAAAAAVRAERGGGAFAWISFAVLGAALVHLHYYGAFVLAALGLHLLVWAWRHDRFAIVKLGLCATVVILAFAPWLPVFRWQLAQGSARSSDTWWQQLALMPLFSIAGRTLLWKEAGIPLVAGADLAIAGLIFVPLTLSLWRASPWPGLVVAFVVGVPLLAALVSLTLAPMIHTHYLAVILPSLMLLIACALQSGAGLGGMRLAALLLSVVMATALVRMYAVPHKTDWRTLAEWVGREHGELPVFFYEDLGADPFAYYRPDQPAHRISMPFAVDRGPSWSPTLLSMAEAKDGFWVVLYLTSAATRAEEPAIDRWLETHFIVEERADFGAMQVRRCRPR